MTPTAALWRHRAHGTPAIPFASALIGSDIGTLRDAVSLSLAASDEAAALLDGMELIVRTLTSTVESVPERCVFSVRGPILWSETITARANALGNEDVFVCTTSGRSFDTVENRVLVAALDAVARAGKALRSPTGERVHPRDARRIAAVADEARRWRAHPRLSDVSTRRLGGRDLARLRGGHRTARMAPVLAVRARVAEPFVAEDLAGLADVSTLVYHRFVGQALDHLVARQLISGPLSLSDGGLWVGAASFRHPAADGGTAPGLCYRGIPLVPARDVYADAWWADRVPVDAVEVHGTADLDRLIDRLTGATRTPVPPAPRSRPPLTSKGSGPRLEPKDPTKDQAPRSSLES